MRFYVDLENSNFLLLANATSIEVHEVGNGTFMPCSHSLQMPQTLTNLTTGGIMGPRGDISLAACGETEDSSSIQTCFIINDHANQLLGHLANWRVGTASIVVGNGSTLWVTGGYEPHPTTFLTTTAIIDETNMDVSNAPFLPVNTKHHCLEKIGPETVVHVGGENIYGELLKLSWFYNRETMSWTSFGYLNRGRARHACGVLKDYTFSTRKILVAAGGESLYQSYTESVELTVWNEDNNAILPWDDGPDLPKRIRNAEGVTTSNQEHFFIAGGQEEDGSIQKSVYALQCYDLQCHWKSFDHALKTLPPGGLALMLPTMPVSNVLSKYNGI